MNSSATRILAATAAATCALLATATLTPAVAQSAPRAGAATTPVLKADYQMRGTLASSVEGAPRLRNVGDGNRFVLAKVSGDKRTKALKFPEGNGLKVNTAGLIPSDSYSTVMNFRLASAGTQEFARVLNPTAVGEDNDNGLYLYDTFMTWYDENSYDGTEGAVTPGEFVEVAFTRSTQGLIRVYVDGQPHLSYTETDGQAIIQNQLLRFFVDNSNGESSTGTVSRIRLFKGAIGPKRVASIYDRGH